MATRRAHFDSSLPGYKGGNQKSKRVNGQVENIFIPSPSSVFYVIHSCCLLLIVSLRPGQPEQWNLLESKDMVIPLKTCVCVTYSYKLIHVYLHNVRIILSPQIILSLQEDLLNMFYVVSFRVTLTHISATHS